MIALSWFGPEMIYVDVFVMNADGTNRRNVTNNPRKEDGSPSWAPDSRQLAYWSQDGPLGIWVIDVENPIRQRLVPVRGFSPSWSPDGTRIAFSASDVDKNGDIYVINLSDGAIKRLTDDPARDDQPTWCGDGRSLVFVSWRDGNAEIYIMDDEGNNVRNLTQNPAEDVSPDCLRTYGLAVVTTENKLPVT
jgi:TolB protein